ncbi:cyclic-di-AMP-binding protein CbpB [Salimicrobium sp. PL1-032A]|uniref:cyclic-di-AMP-binding protein CbpB n=1 Tax=Salimicrobium sp. PL1-032A TaxID=3095364 RepID=UPI0032618DD1
MLQMEREKNELLLVEDLMIPSEKVAHVQSGNPLEHALLVLIKTGYSSVPVLNPQFQFEGVISKTKILEEALGLEQFEMNRLSDIAVQTVMDQDIPCLKKDHTFIDALHKLIDHPFVCVTGEDGEFDGIVTRREILKNVSKSYHESKNK